MKRIELKVDIVQRFVKSIKALWHRKNIEFTRQGNTISFVRSLLEDYEVMEIKL